MTIALLVITDGRKEYIHKTIESASLNLEGPMGPMFMFDDSGEELHRRWLRINFPNFELIYKPIRQGAGGAINSAWEHIRQYEFDYVFHLEDDFTFNRTIPLNDMVRVLEDNPHVYQMALRRQAWSTEEIRIGGIIEKHPEEFHQQDGWISHNMFFTNNPNLYRKSLIETRVFPNVKESEGHFTIGIRASDPYAQFGYWGQKTDPPWVEHIGVYRQGSNY